MRNNLNIKRGNGGVRVKNGKYEGTYVIHRENGTSFSKSFTRSTLTEINDIKAQLRVLGVVENNVKDVKIDRNTNNITLIYKGQTNSKTNLDKNILVKDYVYYYTFEHRKNGISGRKIEDTTFSSYVDKAKFIEEYLGDKKVIDLTFDDIEDFINELHKNTCDTTARQTRDYVTSMMAFAHKDGITTENVLQGNKITLKEHKGKNEKKIIQKEDIKTFVNYCKEHKYYDILFILNTGVRVSEMAGVTWDNIDFEKGTVKIEKTYVRTKKYVKKDGKIIKMKVKEFKDVKSKDSYRTIGINGELLTILKQHKEEQRLLAKKCNKTFKETDWAFTTKNYTGNVADYVGDKFRNIMNKLKIKNYNELTTHCLRHTYCSLGIMAGVPVEAMKEVLGHNNIRSNSRMVYAFR